MSLPVAFLPEAREDLSEAAEWYAASARKEVALSFTRAVRAATHAIARNPYRFSSLEDDVRHLVLAKFPYSILYVVADDAVVILAVFHHRRDPEEWRRRI